MAEVYPIAASVSSSIPAIECALVFLVVILRYRDPQRQFFVAEGGTEICFYLQVSDIET